MSGKSKIVSAIYSESDVAGDVAPVLLPAVAASPAEQQLGAVVGLLRAGGVGFDAREDGAGAGLRMREEAPVLEEGLQPRLAEELAVRELRGLSP